VKPHSLSCVRGSRIVVRCSTAR